MKNKLRRVAPLLGSARAAHRDFRGEVMTAKSRGWVHWRVALVAITVSALPLVGALPAAAAGRITVCASGCDFTSIQAAIDAAPSGGTIVVEAGTYFGALTVDRNHTLLGAGSGQTTIFAGGGTAMTIDSFVSAAVAGVTISGGGAPLGGGILNESGATLTLKNSAVSDNMASLGGGIYNESGATLTVADSTLAGNTAFLAGGAMVNPGGTVSLKNVTVTGNHSLGITPGVGIGGIGNGGTMIVSDSTVTDNHAPSNGGGIFNNLNGVLTVSNSTVSGNSAGGLGGGIFTRGISVALTDSTVSNNTAGIDGGGIYVSTGTVTLQNTTITGNVPDNCAPPGSVSGCSG